MVVVQPQGHMCNHSFLLLQSCKQVHVHNMHLPARKKKIHSGSSLSHSSKTTPTFLDLTLVREVTLGSLEPRERRESLA